MQLDINDDEFRIIYRSLGRAMYHTVEERTETLKLYNRLHHVAVPDDLSVAGEGFPVVAVQVASHDYPLQLRGVLVET